MSDDLHIIEELLTQQTSVVFRAGGPSMTPIIRDGDNVRVRPHTREDLKTFNILLVRLCGRLVLHRLVTRSTEADRCFVAGDAATEGGDWISPDNILGVAEWVQRGSRNQRLDHAGSRMTGWIRYALRPIRRVLLRLRAVDHAHTSAPPS